MTTPLYQSSQVTAGIGKESVYGTAVAPVFYVPSTQISTNDSNSVAPDTAWRGAPGDAFGYASGPLEGAVSLGGDVHADAIGFPLAGLLGDVVASGSGPTTWTMAALNTGTQQPSSYTLVTTDGINSRSWPGLVFADCTLTASADQTLSYTADCASLISATTTGPSQSYTTVPMIAGWRGAHSLGGSSVGTVIDCSVTFARTIQAKRNTDGSQAPYLQRSGVLAVSGSLTLILATDSYRAAYVQGSTSSITLNWAQGSGATATQTQVRCSQITYTDVAPDYSSGAFQQVQISWAAAYNSTDVGASGGSSPCKVTLKNAVASGVY